MRSIKTILLLLLVAISANAVAQVVQPMGYKDYSVKEQMNVGSGRTRLTDSSAYLELGDSASSRKGFLGPRENKDSVRNVKNGLLFFDNVTNRYVVYLTSAGGWVPLGGSGGVSAPAYTDAFTGTSTNQFTLPRAPILQSLVVYVNGQKIPKACYTLAVNTVSLNAGLMGFSTDTFDKVEVLYQSIF